MDLVTYLTNELEQRGWSIRELARRSGVSHPQIGNVLAAKYPASADFCIAIAKGLDVDPVKLLILAGYIPPLPQDTDDPRLAEIWRLVNKLPSSDLAILVRILRGLQDDDH